MVNHPVSRILERKNGDILLLCNDIYILDEVTDDKVIVSRLKYDTTIDGIPYRIIEDNDSNLWMLTEKMDVKQFYRIDTRSHVTPMGSHQARRFLEAIEIGADGNIYTGSLRTGLYRYDPSTDEFIHFTPDDGSDLSIKTCSATR